MSESAFSRPLPPATEDARALLARLYREIGISAVSAALDMREEPEARAPSPAQSQSPREETRAA